MNKMFWKRNGSTILTGAGAVGVVATTVLAIKDSIVCIFGANVLNKKWQASIASAYALLDSLYKDYKNKVKELYGDDANLAAYAGYEIEWYFNKVNAIITSYFMRKERRIIMKFKIKPETAISVALGVLGVVQMLLTNKKEADNRAAMKNELKEEISKELLEKNN